MNVKPPAVVRNGVAALQEQLAPVKNHVTEIRRGFEPGFSDFTGIPTEPAVVTEWTEGLTTFRRYNDAPPVTSVSEAAAEAGREELEGLKSAIADAALKAGFTPEQIAQTLQPRRVHFGSFETTLEDGTRVQFGFNRVQHDLESQGGLRFRGTNSLEQTYALSLGMAAKTGVADRDFGGGKGAVSMGKVTYAPPGSAWKVGDEVPPEKLSAVDNARVGASLRQTLGHGYGNDGIAPDMATGAHTMRAIRAVAQSLQEAAGEPPTAPLVTGKPVTRNLFGRIRAEDGNVIREMATGLGMNYALERAAQNVGLPLKGSTAVVQGSGNVGMWFARLASRRGVAITAMSDAGGAIRSDAGLNMIKLQKHVKQHGTVAGFQDKGVVAIDPKDLWSVQADIVVPAAIEGQLNGVTLPQILEAGTTSGKKKIVLEGANEAATAEGEKFMNEHRDELLSLPGTLANVGGVGTSGIERVQNATGKAIGRRASMAELKDMMYGTFDRVFERHQSGSLSMREATYAEAFEKMYERRQKELAVESGDFWSR